MSAMLSRTMFRLAFFICYSFFHRSNQHLFIESRLNLNIGLHVFVSRMDYSIDERNQFAINEFISPVTTGTLGRL